MGMNERLRKIEADITELRRQMGAIFTAIETDDGDQIDRTDLTSLDGEAFAGDERDQSQTL